MPDDEIEPSAGIIAHRFDVIGRRHVLGIGSLVPKILQLHQPGIAERIPALVIDAAGKQHGGFLGVRLRRECDGPVCHTERKGCEQSKLFHDTPSMLGRAGKMLST